MRIRLPYLQTSPMQDLKFTMAMTPLWWVLGLYFMIYHFAAFLSMTKLLVGGSMRRRGIGIPLRMRWFIAFLSVYIMSILLNAFENSPQRTFASLNNYLIYLSGFFVVVVFYNSADRDDILNILRIGRGLAIAAGVIVLISLALWIVGYHRLSFKTPVATALPFLDNYPYFAVILNVVLVDSDWFFSRSMPRIPVFTSVMTASGGQVLALLPMLVTASAILRTGRFSRLLTYFLSVAVILLSLARTPILALVISIGIMASLSMRTRRRVLFVLLVLLIAVPAVVLLWSFFTGVVDAVLSSRLASTRTRIELYQDAIKYTLEHNPVYGIGIKVREGFTTRALGSHSTYIALFITTGLLGVASYVLFQVDILRLWWTRRARFSGEDRMIWTNIGAAFIGFSLWLLTDTIDAVPYISSLYFILIGILVSWERVVNDHRSSLEGREAEGHARHG